MAAVIIMGVMIVLGVAGLIGVIAHRALSGDRIGHHSASAPMIAPKSSSQHGVVYHGTGHIIAQSVRPDGSIVLLIGNPDGEQVVVWNPDTGLVTAQFALSPQ